MIKYSVVELLVSAWLLFVCNEFCDGVIDGIWVGCCDVDSNDGN